MTTFGQRLRALATERGFSLRRLASQVPCSPAHLSRMASGQRPVPADVAARLDELLGAGGELVMLATVAAPNVASAGDLDRVRHAVARPRRLDTTGLDALRTILAGQRRLEDVVGPGPILTAVRAQTTAAEHLAREARGDVQAEALGVAGEWAQFSGWLHAATSSNYAAARHYEHAGRIAAEAGHVDLLATVRSMRGLLAFQASGRDAGEQVVAWSRRAREVEGTGASVRVQAIQQEARGHAMLGNAADALRLLADAEAAMEAKAGDPDWLYFYDVPLLTLQRGHAHLLLGRWETAAELLADGLGAVDGEIRRSEWLTWYAADLAEALAQLG
ncbi:MAG: helix-turn-helix domain-containing protein, partial [Streptosporangiales bacterium]|nr:helix-turn-helix domain-containing protein [Streptosporangiales bacterium]